jgi:hypothetical protein
MAEFFWLLTLIADEAFVVSMRLLARWILVDGGMFAL